MLKNKNRLKKRKDFAYIYRKGERYFCDDLTLFYVKSRFKNARFGISVSNKVGNAVVRNKIKRRLRAILSQYTNKITYKSLIISVKPEIVDKDFNDIQERIKKLFKKGKILDE